MIRAIRGCARWGTLINVDFIYGLHAVGEALKSRAKSISHVTVARERSDLKLQRIIDQCRATGIPVRFEPRHHLDRMAHTAGHQGVVASVAVKAYSELEDVLAKRVDAATLDSPRAHLVVHQYPQFKIIPGGPDSCIKNPDIPIPIGMAFNYGDAELKKFLEAVVADMQDQLRASLQKHSQLEFMLEPK